MTQSVITVQLDNGLKEAIEIEAKKLRVSKSVVMRHMIKDYLKRNNIEFKEKLTA